MNVWKRLVRLIKLRLRKRRPAPDPLAIINERLRLLDDRLQNVKRKSLELGRSKIQLEHRVRELQRTIDGYQERAREALKLDREDLAVLALRNKRSAQQTQAQLREKVEALAQQIRESERVKEELINQIKIFKIKRDELELTRSAARAQLSLQEERLGLGQEADLIDIQEAFRRLESEIDQIQAEIEATRELEAKPLPPLPRADSTRVQVSPEVARELEQLKREAKRSS